MIGTTLILTVGDLRTAIDGLDDDAQVFAQVVPAERGGIAWSMQCHFGHVPLSRPDKYVLSLSHPDLKTLPAFGGAGLSS